MVLWTADLMTLKCVIRDRDAQNGDKTTKWYIRPSKWIIEHLFY